ncbi:MAG: hypothetical protein ACAH88_07390 [Roseimicrobium sp.]
MKLELPKTASSSARFRGRWQSGSMLLEASIALGAAVMLALLLMKASLLAITGNEWTSMQTLTDSVLTRETALANRMPFADISSSTSLWPDVGGTLTPQTVQLGKLMGGTAVTGQLTRFRVSEVDSAQPEVNLSVWRMHSVLKYKVAGKDYVKSTSTLRVQ